MPPSLPSAAEIKLAKVYESACYQFAQAICKGTRGLVVKEGDICVHARTTTTFGNGLYYAPWSSKDVFQKLKKAIQLYKAADVGMGAITGPSSPILEMREALLSLGFQCAYHVPYMHLDLANIRFPKTSLKKIEVRQIDDFSIFKTHPHAWHGKATTKPRREILGFYEKETQKSKARFRQFIAFEKEIPVASVLMFYNRKTCGVFDVGTLKSHRRRGIGHHLLSTACAVARDEGQTCAALGASGVGVGLYEKTGFTHCGRYGFYYMSKGKLAALDV